MTNKIEFQELRLSKLKLILFF